MTVKKCKIWTSTSNPQLKKKLELGKNIKYWNKVCWKRIVVLASESFTYYVINVYVPRVRANADQVLTTPPRVSRDPKKCWRNMWMAPYSLNHKAIPLFGKSLVTTPSGVKSSVVHNSKTKPINMDSKQTSEIGCGQPLAHSAMTNSLPVVEKIYSLN